MLMLVTGAANGIGAAIAEMAVAAGHRVVAADLAAEALATRWAGQAAVQCETLDVRQARQWDALVEKIERERGPLDVLVNVAGVLRSGQVGELKPADIDLTLAVNTRGMIYGANAVARVMKPRKQGHIINIGSLASIAAAPGVGIYCASKFAMRGFTIAAHGDLKPYGIAVSLVGPGPVKTQLLENERGNEDAALIFQGARALSAEEVAAAVLGPVLRKRPIEYYLPWRDKWLGRIANAVPTLMMGQVDRLRARGRKHFSSSSYHD